MSLGCRDVGFASRIVSWLTGCPDSRIGHHEKLCVVDNRVAAMGGLDACFGRWDTSNHELADVHPQSFYKTLYPGQDYNNSRLMDFQTVDQFTSNALAIQDAGQSRCSSDSGL